MASELKSITQLRSSGELRRFQDELEYLLSGLDASQSLGVRRTSALELVRKSAGASGRDSEMEGAAAGLEFLRRLKATDAIGRVWGLLRTAGGGEGDEVCDLSGVLSMRHSTNASTTVRACHRSQVLDATLVVFLSQLTQHQAHTEPLLREAQWGPDVYYALGTMLKRSIASDDNGGKDGLAKLMRGAKIQRSEEALVSLNFNSFCLVAVRRERDCT